VKRLAICFLLSAFCLLLIAARPKPRPCGTRTQCFNLLFPIATMTSTATMTPTTASVLKEDYQGMISTPSHPIGWPPFPPPTVARTSSPVLILPPPPIPPSVYPPPVTAPPAGYP